MSEWNQPPGSPSLDDVFEKIRLIFGRFKGGPALILGAVVNEVVFVVVVVGLHQGINGQIVQVTVDIHQCAQMLRN